MTARINWDECSIIDNLDDITVRVGAYIDPEDMPYVKEYIIRQFEIDFNAYLLKKHNEDYLLKKHNEDAQSIKSYRCEDCANKDTVFCDSCESSNELGSKPSKWEQIENCSTCRYDYSPVSARCVGCKVILPIYPHGIEAYQHWESKEPSTHKDCDEGRICPKCGKVMILRVLCEDEKNCYEIWECDGCGYKEED